jgi:hypothetical protein
LSPLSLPGRGVGGEGFVFVFNHVSNTVEHKRIPLNPNPSPREGEGNLAPLSLLGRGVGGEGFVFVFNLLQTRLNTKEYPSSLTLLPGREKGTRLTSA